MNLGHLDFDIVSNFALRISDLWFREWQPLSVNFPRPSTSVESPLQIHLFLQNKPNFQNAQINVTSINTMNYELRTMNYFTQNKPNSNPIKPNFKANQTQFQTTPAPQTYRKRPGAYGRFANRNLCLTNRVNIVKLGVLEN